MLNSAPPIAQIISRGRAVRARRRITGVAGALALAAGTALAVRQLADALAKVTAPRPLAGESRPR